MTANFKKRAVTGTVHSMPGFRRSIDDHVKYYRGERIEEKLAETIAISDLCANLARTADKAGFNGK